MTPEEIEKLLSRLSVNVDMHSMFLTVLIACFFADYPAQKQRMVDALNSMKQLPGKPGQFSGSYRASCACASGRNSAGPLTGGGSPDRILNIRAI